MENKENCHINFSHPWQEYLSMYNVHPDKYREFYEKFGYYRYTKDDKNYTDTACEWITHNSQENVRSLPDKKLM